MCPFSQVQEGQESVQEVTGSKEVSLLMGNNFTKAVGGKYIFFSMLMSLSTPKEEKSGN